MEEQNVTDVADLSNRLLAEETSRCDVSFSLLSFSFFKSVKSVKSVKAINKNRLRRTDLAPTSPTWAEERTCRLPAPVRAVRVYRHPRAEMRSR